MKDKRKSSGPIANRPGGLVVAGFHATRHQLYGICVRGSSEQWQEIDASFRQWRVGIGFHTDPDAMGRLGQELHEYLSIWNPDYIAIRTVSRHPLRGASDETLAAIKVIRALDGPPKKLTSPVSAERVMKQALVGYARTSDRRRALGPAVAELNRRGGANRVARATAVDITAAARESRPAFGVGKRRGEA